MVKLIIKSLKNMKPENFSKLNEILRFYDGFDNLVDYLYTKLKLTLGNLENVNTIMKKPLYIIPEGRIKR